MMSLAPLRTTTALVASLSLILPHPIFVASASAQEATLSCLDESEPPCPEGEPEEGSTPLERANYAAAQARDAVRMMEETAAAAAAEALRLEQEAVEAEAADAAGADQARLAADRAKEQAVEAEAQVEALRADAIAKEQAVEDAAAAEAEADAAAAEAEAQAAEDAAAVEAEAQAVEDAAAAEAEAQAVEDAAAAEADAEAAEDAAAAEAEAQAVEDAAAAEAEAQAAEDAAAAEAEAQAAEDAAAAEAEAEAAEDAAAAEAEAQAAEDAAAVEAEAQAAEDAAAAEAEAEAVEDAATAEAAEEAVPEETPLVDPTVTEEDVAPAAASSETTETPDDVVVETLDEESVRTSTEDFETAIDGAATKDNGDSGLSNIEKALLLGLGAVVVGSVLRNGDRVVENTGDRVVVESDQGLTIYKNDDALLRQSGATIRTETFDDGSSRSTVDRVDGSQVVTIRDQRGRVLRRTVVYADGSQYELFDDLEPVPAVDVSQLQEMRPVSRSLSVADNDLAALRTALREDLAFDAGRRFSLRQIREIEQVRKLVPAIDLDTVTFATGSAAIPSGQAGSLFRLGALIEELLLENPREVFLIEGHTDAVGSRSYNLALSDRRAESVALALTETFRIPPENLIVQGYGEAFLKVETQEPEQSNRRATVRRITPLLR